MVNIPTLTLNNGLKMPGFGLGTYAVCAVHISKNTKILFNAQNNKLKKILFICLYVVNIVKR